jgi:hypothetical protein
VTPDRAWTQEWIRRWRGSVEPTELPSVEDFKKGSGHRFGRSNPELMQEPVWEMMVRTGFSAYGAKSLYGLPDLGPIWTFDRYGISMTFVNPNLFVFIGGGYEAGGFPDFLIFNEVIVTAIGGDTWIFSYPKTAFPPTHFHTATLFDNKIYIVGGLGYEDHREFWRTPVYMLNLRDMMISEVETTGENPGWIYHHSAVLRDNVIEIEGGKRENEAGETTGNEDKYQLNVLNREWIRIG